MRLQTLGGWWKRQRSILLLFTILLFCVHSNNTYVGLWGQWRHRRDDEAARLMTVSISTDICDRKRALFLFWWQLYINRRAVYDNMLPYKFITFAICHLAFYFSRSAVTVSHIVKKSIRISTECGRLCSSIKTGNTHKKRKNLTFFFFNRKRLDKMPGAPKTRMGCMAP